jgi:hypothetical protein
VKSRIGKEKQEEMLDRDEEDDSPAVFEEDQMM